MLQRINHATNSTNCIYAVGHTLKPVDCHAAPAMTSTAFAPAYLATTTEAGLFAHAKLSTGIASFREKMNSLKPSQKPP